MLLNEDEVKELRDEVKDEAGVKVSLVSLTLT